MEPNSDEMLKVPTKISGENSKKRDEYQYESSSERSEEKDIVVDDLKPLDPTSRRTCRRRSSRGSSGQLNHPSVADR
jgi:hypothetical protein